MLKSVRLVNFRTHTDTTIHFDKHTTAIKGNNNVGKSAVWRAVKLTLANEPLPEKSIRYGAKEARIEVTFFDGRKVVRVRGPKGQSVELYAPDGSLVKRGDVVDDMKDTVREFTGITTLPNDSNYQQFVSSRSPRDWGLNMNASSTLQYINALSNDYGLEGAQKRLKSEQRELVVELRVADTNIERNAKLVAVLERFNIDAMHARSASLDKLEARIRAAEADLVRLWALRKTYQHRVSRHAAVEANRTRIEAVLKRAGELYGERVEKPLADAQFTMDSWVQLRTRYTLAENKVYKLEKQLSEEMLIENNNMCPTCGKPL